MRQISCLKFTTDILPGLPLPPPHSLFLEFYQAIAAFHEHRPLLLYLAVAAFVLCVWILVQVSTMPIIEDMPRRRMGDAPKKED